MLFPKGSMVFDIGAHHGESALAFLAAGAGHVICVEPCLPNYLMLKARIGEDPRVEILHAAVLQRPSIEKIFMAGAQDGLSTMDTHKWSKVYPAADFRRGWLVACVTPTMLRKKFGMPDYIKIDAEGMDHLIVSGICRMLQEESKWNDKWPVVSFEMMRPYEEEAAIALQQLAEIGGYTKATFIEGDLPVTMPAFGPIDLIIDLVRKKEYRWGNITVMR